jgi:hypothetical protein
MDFTTTKNRLDFTIDGTAFESKNAIAAGVIFDLQALITAFGNKESRGIKQQQIFVDMKAIYERILTAESFARFEPLIDGHCEDEETPVDAMLFIEITKWIIGEGLGKGRMAKQPSSQAG